MANTLTASNFDELYSALAVAQGGDTILLAGGDYGKGRLKPKGDLRLDFPEDVTIMSADIDDPAIFQGLNVNSAKNLVFDGIVFDYRFAAGDSGRSSAFGFYDSDGLTIRNSVFDGDLAQGVSAAEDGFGYGTGAVIRNSKNVVFENNEMFEFFKGIRVGQSENVVLRGNDIHSMRMDGINFAEVQGILIEDNHIHDFRRTTLKSDHADMIQAWTASTKKPSTDIMIRSNTLDIGDGDATQSIFIGNTLVDRGQAGEEMYFRNVTIQDNLIVNAQTHGIALGASIGVVITGNRVLHDDGNAPDGADSAVEIPSIGVSPLSSDVVVTDNITAKIKIDVQDREDWTVAGNVLVQDQDRTAPNHYDQVFIASTVESHDFVVLENGPAGHLAVSGPGGLQVRFHAVADPANTAARSFDASSSLLDHAALPNGTEFIWDFGDGTYATGPRVTHVFPDVGRYPVTLSVTIPGGTSAQAAHEVTLSDPQLISYTAGGAIALTAEGFSDPFDDVAAMDAGGIALGVASGPALSIPRLALSDLFNARSFSIDLGMTLTEGGKGTLFRFGQDINAWVGSDGNLAISVATTEKSVYVKTQGINLADGMAHETSLRLTEGQLELWVDGALADSAPMTGVLANKGNHSFWLGTPWGASVPGVIDALSIAADTDIFLPEPGPEIEALPGQIEGNLWKPVLDFDADTGFLSHTADGPRFVDANHVMSGIGLELGKKGLSGSIDRGYVDTLASSDGFRMAFTVSADSDSSAGKLVNLAGSVFTHVRGDGNLLVRVKTQEDGVHRFKTKDIDMSDGNSKDIVLTYIDQQLAVTIDGITVIEETLASPIAKGNSAGLLFGNAWGHKNFTGTLENFAASTLVGPDDDPAEMDGGTVVEEFFMCVPDENLSLGL